MTTFRQFSCHRLFFRPLPRTCAPARRSPGVLAISRRPLLVRYVSASKLTIAHTLRAAIEK